jgi:hypothetical protein
MVLYKVVTNDADSILIAYYDVPDIATNGFAYAAILDPIGAVFIDAP